MGGGEGDVGNMMKGGVKEITKLKTNVIWYCYLGDLNLSQHTRPLAVMHVHVQVRSHSAM